MATQLNRFGVPTVDYRGAEYTLLFHDQLRPLHDGERDDLRASIKQHGVRNPVLIFESRKYGPRCVIDGANRLSLASELGKDVGFVNLPLESDSEAEELALDLNECRRQLTPEELSAQRQARIKRVVAARSEGASLRTIAEQEQISDSQVRRDLATAPLGAVEPEVVKGRDGKTRTAKPTTPSKAKPFAELMSRVTSLTADLTRAINSDEDYGLKLHIYMRVCGLLDYPNDDGKGKKPRVLPLAGIHSLLELAGKPGPTPTEKEIRLIYDKANGSWLPPLTQRRRARKRQR